MNQRNVFILSALIFAILITLIIFKQRKVQPQDSQPSLNVLFATKDMDAGKTLQADNFTWHALSSQDMQTPNMIIQGSRSNQDLIGSRILVPLLANQPIKENMLLSKGALSPLARVLQPGMRAFTIDINTASAIAGLIKPGDIVDIILTEKKTSSHSPTIVISRTILHKMHVIAVDNVILNTPPGQKSDRIQSNTKHITLEVTPKQAEILALAKAVGTLSLSLTVPSDVDQPPAETEKGHSVILYHGEKAETGGS